MATTEEVTVPRKPLSSLALWSLGLCFVALVTIFAGVGVAALLARRGGAGDWSRWSDVGQTFGALGSVISGLTLVALVVTARMQFREMQENRRELEQQRHSLADNHQELRKASSAAFRQLHLELLKLSIDDPSLAEVWPAFEPNVSAMRNRQYLYANIVYQFQYASMQVDGYNDEQVLAALRYLFTSPLMRGYWQAAARARESLVPGSAEFTFSRRVDDLCREFDAVVASASRPKANVKPHDERQADETPDEAAKSSGYRLSR
jgi:hypothetical protein